MHCYQTEYLSLRKEKRICAIFFYESNVLIGGSMWAYNTFKKKKFKLKYKMFYVNEISESRDIDLKLKGLSNHRV